MRQEADAVVVGGGLAGLTAAVILGRAGRKVELFESGSLGGRAATLHQDGYHFNEGPHALYVAGHAAATFQELGIPFTGGIPGSDPAPLAVDRGELHVLP